MSNESDSPESSDGKKVNIRIKIPPHIKPRLQELAAKSGLSLDKYVSEVIEYSVRKMGKEIDSKPFEFILGDNPLSDEDMRLVQEFLSSLSGEEGLG